MAMIQNKFNFSNLTKIVLNENKKWQGGKLKEGKSAAAPMLQKYWRNIGKTTYKTKDFASNTWQNKHPWSAVYVSWIMNQVDKTFPKSSAHRGYARKGAENRNNGRKGWTLYSLSREKSPIKAQVGDVMIGGRGAGGKSKAKGGTKEQIALYKNSHGDLVWKVSGGVAYLAGGNVGDTNGISKDKGNVRPVSLNSDGSYKKMEPKTGRYIVVLKKM